MDPKLKDWLIENGSVARDADGAEFDAALKSALADGKLSADKYAELNKSGDDPAKKISGMVSEAVASAMTPLAKSMEALAAAVSGRNQPEPAPEPDPEPSKGITAEQIDAIVERHMEKVRQQSLPDPMTNFIVRGASQPRVKKAIESYSSTKGALVFPMETPNGLPHPKAGKRVLGWNKRPMDEASEADEAIAGAFLKAQVLGGLYKSGWMARMTEHELDLYNYALHECKWAGFIGSETGEEVRNVRLTDAQRKAVINDTTSGGTYAIPDQFDDTVWRTPLLYGELFPHVDLVNLPRGATVEGFTVGDITATWNQAEGSAYSLPSTSGLVNNLDTSIFPLMLAIEMGLDWLSDTPVDFVRDWQNRFGERAQYQLDYVIAVGNGTSQPEGIFTKSGVTSTSSANGSGGAFTVGDFESLIFGMDKAMRQARGGRVQWVMSDTMYRRASSVPVGTTDARRVMQPELGHASYVFWTYPVRIQNDISNGSLALWNPAFYRMYRRVGTTFRTTMEGENLVKKNALLLSMRARWGGQVTIASSVNKMTDGDSTDG